MDEVFQRHRNTTNKGRKNNLENLKSKETLMKKKIQFLKEK